MWGLLKAGDARCHIALVTLNCLPIFPFSRPALPCVLPGSRRLHTASAGVSFQTLTQRAGHGSAEIVGPGRRGEGGDDGIQAAECALYSGVYYRGGVSPDPGVREDNPPSGD